jgi:hypothetical protein
MQLMAATSVVGAIVALGFTENALWIISASVLGGLSAGEIWRE